MQVEEPMPAAPLLETARLWLCLPSAPLAAELSAYHRRNEAHFAPYTPRCPAGYHAVEAWYERAAEQAQRCAGGEALHLLLFPRGGGSLLGEINFTGVIGRAFQAAYLGYKLDRAAVGKGLMYEALSAAIPFACEHLKLHRVMANFVPSNARSASLLKRLGFGIEGYAREYLLLDGVWKDHVLTSFINPDWRAEPVD
jgi:ribosomal-protein-alanine N-acetyltransferase